MFYFILYLLLLYICDALFIRFVHPFKMFLGVFAIGVAFGLFSMASNAGPQVLKFKEEHPIASLFALLIGAYFIVYLLDGIIVFLLGILLPFAGKISSSFKVHEHKVCILYVKLQNLIFFSYFYSCFSSLEKLA